MGSNPMCPYKKRQGHRQARRADRVRTQRGGGCPQDKELSLRRNRPCWHLDLRLLVFRTMLSTFLLFKLSVCGTCCGRLSKLIGILCPFSPRTGSHRPQLHFCGPVSHLMVGSSWDFLVYSATRADRAQKKVGGAH